LTPKKSKKEKNLFKKAPDKSPDGKRPAAVYLFTGMALKMALVIYLGIIGGQKLDEQHGAQVPWFTLLGALAGVGLSFYFVIQDVRKL
jgi:F0F1-type ATP synthase assembly protein I